MLQLEEDMDVVGEASTAKDGLDLLRHTPCDVALVDLKLPDHDGIWLTRRAREEFPQLRSLILTMHREDELIMEAIEAGARGYVLKTAANRELLDAIRTVGTGGLYLHHEVVGTVMGELHNRRSSTQTPSNGALSDREMEIIRGLADGRSNQQLADQLHLSLSTIKAQLRDLFARFSVTDRTQLVVEAMRRGLIDAPRPEPRL